MTGTRHRWGEKARFEHKTEQQCTRCEAVKVTRHEWQAGRAVYWTEFWRDLDRIDQDNKTPPCDARLEQGAGGASPWKPEAQNTSL